MPKPTVNMIATRALRYGGRSLRQGSSFMAEERHVRVLIATRQAIEAPPPKPVEIPAPPSWRTPEDIEAREQVIAALDEMIANAEPKPKRKYVRRDLTAET